MHLLISMLLSVLLLACDDKGQSNAPETLPANQGYHEVPPTTPSLNHVNDPAIINISEIIAAMGLQPYHAQGYRGQNLKIAILDNGFLNLEQSLGRRLPPNLQVQPAPGNQQAPTLHGTKIAELVYSLATGSPNYSPERPGPELMLFNTNGFTNLRHAIDQVITQNVDIVIYSQIWEYGGNQDGRGFINAEVNRATNAGVLWVNAAGNYAESTYNTKIELRPDREVMLPDADNSLGFLITHPGTETKITLAWNDFLHSINYRSAQDLDLFLYDAERTLVASSTLTQDGLKHPMGLPGYTHHAREIIRAVLDPGIYYIKVQAKSDNFHAESRLTIAIDGLDARLITPHNSQSIFIPADNPSVLTVGAADVSYSSFSETKPELVTSSRIEFHDGTYVDGSSSAAAIAAASLAVWQSKVGKLTHRQIVRQINSGRLTGQATQQFPTACQRWLDRGLTCPYATHGSAARLLVLPEIP